VTNLEPHSRGLEGILVALVTPFTENGDEVNHRAIPGIVDLMVSAGISGIIPCGSTGEFNALSTDERKAVADSVATATDGRAALVPHVGSVRTPEAVDLMLHAAALGADAVMAVPPFYDKLTWDDVIAYYGAISQAAPEVPIMAYHYPEATGALVTVDQLLELVQKVPAVSYLKDSGGDARLLDRLLQEVDGPGIRVFNGSDTLTFHGLAAGAAGGVWGAASFMPTLAVQLYAALHDRGDLAEGRRLWSLVRPIVDLLESNVYPVAVKAGCDLVGMEVGPPRAPLSPLPAEQRELLRGLLEVAGLLGDSASA
jgi:dihydrodipicolinate synthase/N-acetylneuraminate lyase